MEKPLKLIFAVLIFVFLSQFDILLADNPSAICLDCHDDMAQSLAGSAHQLTTERMLKSSLKVECVDCHDGWQEHADNPEAGNIGRGDKLTMAKEAELCSRCHINSHQTAMMSTDPHNKADLQCSSCHTIHNNMNAKLVKEEMPNFCLSCHTTTQMDFHMRSAHPLEVGAVSCVDCHKLGMAEKPEFAVGFNWTCQGCHDDQAGPFLYEHPVTYNHLVDGGGCTECHNPHGSVNDRLLKEPRSGLCLQCHSIPPGHMTNHSGLGAKLDCVTCHTEIHGSYESRLFLDPDLGIKLFPDCYQSGCHTINGN